MPDLAAPFAELQKQAALFAPKLGASLLILAGFWLAGCLSNRLIRRVADRSEPARRDVIELIAQIARTSLLVFGTVTALGTLGINVSALVAGLGLTGFALGFAFRDALSNILAGVLIVMYRPFLRGDHIAVVGFEGKVAAIDLRYTTLQRDDKIFLIPNSTLFTNPISLTQTAKPSVVPPVPAPEAAALRARIGLDDNSALPVGARDPR
jgi:small-conductance mechanosensitive channel